MTYHLAAFRLHSVGERSARFADLTLDLTAPNGTSEGPADTVVWLRNGGGKSSLLSLFYALLLPRANDFMGRAVKRSLTDYVDSGDTAHAVAAWHPAAPQTLDGTPERVLVTGVVYEWSDLRRPAGADRARDRLDTTFYAFYAVPGALDLTRLPILDESGTPRRRAAYLAALKEIAAAYPQAMDYVTTDKQHEWTSALTSRGIDPALFRTQKQMNHVEGGVEDLFRFSSAREFIDLLIDLTVAPEDATSVADRLASIAALLATKPARMAERGFCLDAASGLDRISVCQGEVDASALAHQRAVEEATQLSAAFAAAVARAQDQIRLLDGERGEVDKRRAAAETERGAAYDLAYLYEERAAGMRVQAAGEQVSRSEKDIGEAAGLVAAWEAAEQLATRAELRDALDRTRLQAREERERTAPQRRQHDEHAARLRTRLHILAGVHDGKAEAAATAAELATADVESRRKAAAAARQDAKAADKDAATATARLESLATDLRDAARDGVLPSEHTDPAAHDAVLAGQHDTLAELLDEIRLRREQRPGIRSELTSRLTALTGEQIRLDTDRTRSAAERAGLAERAATLAAHERLRDLTEATDDEPVDVWAESDTLIRRLSDAILGADVALVRLEAERVDDQRTLDAHARTGVLPTTPDAERVQTVLSGHGIVAETGWAHLRTLLPGTRVVDAVTDPDLARLGVGLVVPTDLAVAARTALAALDEATTALVSVYTARAAAAIVQSAPARPDGSDPVTSPPPCPTGPPLTSPPPCPTGPPPVWTALRRGLVDPSSADSEVRQVTSRAKAYEEKRSRLTESREADRALLGELTAFLGECPAGHLDSLARRVDDLDRTLNGIQTTLGKTKDEMAELEEADRKDTVAERETRHEVSGIEQARGRLAALIRKVRAAAGWRADLAAAESRATDAYDLAERHTASANHARDTATQQGALAEAERKTAHEYRSEAAGVTFLDDEHDVPGDPAMSLDLLRARYADAARAWQAQASQSVLDDRERRLTAALAEVTQALAAVPDEVQHRAAALLAGAAGQTKATRAAALAAAREAEKEAIGDKARADADVVRYSETLAKTRARRTDPPRRPLPVEPTTPEHADALAADHELIGQACNERRTKAERELADLDREQAELRSQVTAFQLLADGLPDPAGRTAAAFTGSAADAKARRKEVTETVRRAEQRAQNAAVTRASAVGDLRTIGGRYPGVATPAKDRVLHDGEEILARHAEALATQLRLRAEVIDGELDGIAKDQAIVTDSLARLVSNTLDTLRKAERYSRVDTKTGGWSGKQMLRISFDAPPSDADLRTYVNRVVERRIADGVKPEGLPLLKDAVHEAAGTRGFTVKVLKPTLDLVATTEDITRLGKWSGGEKLTVCVALYCTIAALRAANAGRRDRSGGVLLLDNPIGRASHGSLVGLQRAVATAHKVQLVYTTGVKDPDAVSRFPNVIRLDNRPGRTRSRRYIVPDDTPAHQQDLRYVSGVRVAHAETSGGGAG